MQVYQIGKNKRSYSEPHTKLPLLYRIPREKMLVR